MPINQQAANQAADILERLSGLIKAGGTNKFALRAIENEARGLLTTDAFRAYVILGVLSMHEEKIAEGERHFRAAFNLNKSDYVARFNYTTSLRELGYCHLGYIHGKRHLNPKGNLKATTLLAKLAFESLQFTEALEFNRLHKNMTSGNSAPDIDELFTMRLSDQLASENVSEDDAGMLVFLAEDLLREKEITARSMSIDHLSYCKCTLN